MWPLPQVHKCTALGSGRGLERKGIWTLQLRAEIGEPLTSSLQVLDSQAGEGLCRELGLHRSCWVPRIQPGAAPSQHCPPEFPVCFLLTLSFFFFFGVTLRRGGVEPLELIFLLPPMDCVCILWCSAGNQTQSFVHTGQVLLQLSCIPSPNICLLSSFSEPLAKG